MPKKLGSRGLRLLDRLNPFFQYVETEPKYEPVELDKLITLIKELGGRYGAGNRYNVRNWGNFTRAAAAGAGTSTILTVPVNERVIIDGLTILRTGGDGTITQLRCYSRSQARFVVLFAQSAAADVLMTRERMAFPMVMDQDMGLAVYVSALTGDSTWSLDWQGGSLAMRVD